MTGGGRHALAASPRKVAGEGVTDTAPIHERYPGFASLLVADADADDFQALRRAESIGSSLADATFLDRLEALTGRRLKRQKPG